MVLNEKKVLVTGASKGIGRSTAIEFAKKGSSIAINFKSDKKSAEEVCDECNKYSSGNFIIQADVAYEDQVKRMASIVKNKFRKLDVIINNVGIFDLNDSPDNVEVFENIYKNNFLSCVLVNKYLLKLINKGKIVNVSSVHGKIGHGYSDTIAYSAFKAALESYTKNLAKTLAPNILVNAVAPGRVATPMWGSPDEKEQKDLGKAHLIKRMIQPEEVAQSILFLAENDAVCGEILTIDGGMSLLTLR